MDFTKRKSIPGVAVFLDFEKAFDSIEWDFIQNALKHLILVQTFVNTNFEFLTPLWVCPCTRHA